MITADIPAVENIYASVLNETYISYGELHLGLASSPDSISSDALAMFHQELLDIESNDHKECYVACLEDQVLGFAIANMRQGAKGMLECWIEDIGVSEQYRQMGIANNLYKVVLDWAKKNGAHYTFSEANFSNSQAHKLATKNGFSPLCIIFVKPMETDQT